MTGQKMEPTSRGTEDMFSSTMCPSGGGDGTDPQIFYSRRPFLTRQVHPITSADFNAEAGPYISEANDIYYTRTFIVLEPEPHEATPRKIVVNDGSTIIDMGTGGHEGNPHYCDEWDELYANIEYESGDTDIAVFKDGCTSSNDMGHIWLNLK